MTIEIPTWVIWALLNLIVVVGIICVAVRQMLAVERRLAAELETREAYHVDVYERMEREAADLRSQLANLSTLWLVGRHVRGNHWDVQGIFASREEAIAACKNVRYFLFPLDLGVSLPEESTTPFKLEYPKEAE